MKIAVFLPSLSGGGAERAVVNLLRAFAGFPVELDLVLASAEGPYLNDIPEDVRVVDLGRQRVTRAILPLRRYLKSNRPDVLLSHLSHANLAAMAATMLTRSTTRRVLVEHLTMSAYQGTVRRDKWIRPLARRLYPAADAVVSVSCGAARDLEQQLRLPVDSVRVIYNPVVDDSLLARSNQVPDIEWFATDSAPPTFLAAGRFTPQKDFATLVQAFAIVRAQTPARLVILGEGELRGELEAQIRGLQLDDSVQLPGFLRNPYCLMKRATCLVLSSRWEALPTVMIEALACGCPIVSTNCPSGPDEILQGGRFGELVEVQDPEALANAMLGVISNPPDRSSLAERGAYFSFQRSAEKYYELFRELQGFKDGNST